MIPKIIHKIWFDFSKDGSGKSPKKKHIKYQTKCLEMNNDFSLMMWDEKMADSFMKERFPDFYKMYLSYPHPIQRVDAVRYFILYEYGGLYMDMDIKCVKPFDMFDDFEKEEKVYLIEEASKFTPYKFNNCFIASTPKHPFWKIVFDTLKIKVDSSKLPFVGVMSSTGPGMLQEAYNSCDEETKNKIEILPREKFNPCNGCGECSDAEVYIKHKSRMDWTNKFEGIVRIWWCHPKTSIGILLFIVIIILILIYYFKYYRACKKY